MKSIDSSARCICAGESFTAEPVVKQMDQHGISHAVISPPDQFLAVYNEQANRQSAELVHTYPGRLSALAVVNPWYGRKAVQMLQEAFDAGLAGLYLHPPRQGFQLTENIVDPLIEVCIENCKAVYTHTGTPISCMPFQLSALARRFPQARFVLGHFAYTDFAGYDVIPCAEQAPNIYIETSCTPGALLVEALNRLGRGRLLFGSGFPRSDPGWELEKIRALNLAEDTLEDLMHGTAQRIWKLQS